MKRPVRKFLSGGGEKRPSSAPRLRSGCFTRREFLGFLGACFCSMGAPFLGGLPEVAEAQSPQKGLIKTKLSPYFTPLTGTNVRCDLCPRRCIVADGKRGFCRVRENRGGKFYSLVYGNPCAVHLDPIEKKPFLHVLPASTSLSVATAGCNFHCKFCQNWEISQASPEEVYALEISPQALATRARAMGARSIAYTYVEPTIFFEFMVDVCEAAKKEGLLNVIHSNGFINRGPLMRLSRLIDAAQIDLKGFSEEFYRDLCSGELGPVLETLKTLSQEGVHLEITNLVIPTKNDGAEMIREMCLWIIRELGPETPLHLSRFYPLYKLTKIPPTPVSTLEEARASAVSAGLQYVYIGNVPGHEAWHTTCPGCKRTLIRRTGYIIREMHLKKDKCGFCGRPIPGIWAE